MEEINLSQKHVHFPGLQGRVDPMFDFAGSPKGGLGVTFRTVSCHVWGVLDATTQYPCAKAM